MTVRRFSVVASLALALAACGRETVAPQGTLVGRFGGRAVELVATGEGVRVQFTCNVAQFARPLIPSTDGAFSLSPTLVPLGNGRGTAAVMIRGVTRSTEIEFDAIWLASSGVVTTTHYTVRADQPADHSNLACLAGT